VQRRDIQVPASLKTAEILASLREHLEAGGYIVILETSLASLLGSGHLHIRKPGAKSGTLEFTVTPDGTAWLSYHENRFKEWIPEAMEYASRCFQPGN
jgi:hypothetical protein